MWELIICVAVNWGGHCVQQRPIPYPSRTFCERAIPAQAHQLPKGSQFYCRPR